MSIELTPSENARYVRAELEVIASALRVAELAELVAHARALLDRGRPIDLDDAERSRLPHA